MAWVLNGTPLSVRITSGSPYVRKARSKVTCVPAIAVLGKARHSRR
jgi:hypothetical protein